MELWLLDAISLVALHGSVFKIKGTSEATAKSWQKRVFYISAELFPKGINVCEKFLTCTKLAIHVCCGKYSFRILIIIFIEVIFFLSP